MKSLIRKNWIFLIFPAVLYAGHLHKPFTPHPWSQGSVAIPTPTPTATATPAPTATPTNTPTPLPVQFDAASNSGANAIDEGTLLLSWSHTVGLGSGLALTVECSFLDLLAASSVTGVTYNGAPMALAGTATSTAVVQLWKLLGVTAGTANVNVQFAFTEEGAPDVTTYRCGAQSWKNVSSFGTAQTNTGTTSPITVGVSTVSTNNFVVDSADGYRSTSAMTLTATGTQHHNLVVGGTTLRHTAASQRKAGTGGSVTMSWTQSVNRPWGIVAVEVRQ